MTKQDIKAKFFRDTAKHSMRVLKDDGLYRHLRFSNDGSSVYRFDLITWPGYLAYVGDMGDYVFSRIDDMFCFFARRDDKDRELTINPGYWSEKVQAYCRDGIKEFTKDKFIEVIDDLATEFVDSHFSDHDPDDDSDEAGPDDFLAAVQDEVKDNAGDQESAYDAASNFEWDGTRIFDDFYEHDLTDYTLRFEWCLWAIVWGIKQYDQSKQIQSA